jgi:hypothetical protein
MADMVNDKIEGRVSETILQKSEEIVIGGETYTMEPPTTATLILASEAIAQLPMVALNGESMVSESLYIAKDCRVLGDIVAILILGAKRLKETKITVRTAVRRRFFGLIRETENVEERTVVDNKAALSEKVLNELTPQEINSLLSKMLSKMETAFFFGTIIFLIDVNLTRATKTTASGQ